MHTHSYLTVCKMVFISASASCLIYAGALPAHPRNTYLSIVWVHSFIEPDLFDNNVPFDNTIPIYLINLLWKFG